MFINKNLYNSIRKVIPTICVDLIVLNEKDNFLLVRRNESPAKEIGGFQVVEYLKMKLLVTL